MVPEMRIDYSPIDMLQEYEVRLNNLTSLLYAIEAPILLLTFLFLGLVGSISFNQNYQEFAMMRGRGVNFYQLTVINVIESLIFIAISLPVALLIGWLAAGLMGLTEMFLNFSQTSVLDLQLKDINLNWLFVTIALILVTRFVPILSLRKKTIINVKSEKSRNPPAPLWVRFYLDFILFAITGYGLFRLMNQPAPVETTQQNLDCCSFYCSQFFINVANFSGAYINLGKNFLPDKIIMGFYGNFRNSQATL
jgi:putative ABC transport system permease protein